MRSEEEIAQAVWEKNEREKIEEVVDGFAENMKAALCENLHKSGWDEMHPADIWPRIRDELDELRTAVHDMKYPPTLKDRVAVAKEAVDIANFAMFAWFWGLDNKNESPELVNDKGEK
jgi:hypothetical protein